MPDKDDTRSTSEKRHQALEAQMKQRQFVQRLKERGERIKNAESTPLEKELRSRLWWECALAGTATCIGTAAILRRRAGVVASTLGGVLVGNLTFGGVFARRVEPFFEKICAQPEHSPRVDSLLCPTFLDLKAMMAEEPPAKAVSGAMTRIWELCEGRAERFSGGVADTSSNDGWAGQPSAGDWSSPGGPSDDWASPGNQSTDEDRWYQPPPK